MRIFIIYVQHYDLKSQPILIHSTLIKTRLKTTKLSLKNKENNQHIILYNRIPKTASETLNYLFHQQSHKKYYRMIHSNQYVSYNLSLNKQYLFIKQIYTFNPPILYERHVYFVDFLHFNKQQPIYINMIRDPIKRTVSNYYYSRRMCLKKNRCTFIKNRTILNYTLDDCIETENEPFKCITLEYGVTSAIPFFCGQNHLCSSNENLSWAVEKAKSNIDKYYTVVGLTENIEQLLFILEKLLPNYFRNISLVYIKKRRPHINFSPRKWRKELKPNTHLILKDLLKFEYDLYNYIKKRFHEQYKQLQLINKIHE